MRSWRGSSSKERLSLFECHQSIICAHLFSASQFFHVGGIDGWNDGDEGNNNNETAIKTEPLSLFPFRQQLFEDMSLKRTQFAIRGANIIEHNSLFYFPLPLIKRLLLWFSYNLPAHHKLNLPCFLWLTKEHKLNGPQTKAFHSPCKRQCINPIGHVTASFCEWPMLSKMVRWSGCLFISQGNNSIT